MPTPDRIAKACAQYGYTYGCIVPGCAGRPRLHHLVPRRAGGTDALHNQIAICPEHEHRVHFAGAVARALERRPGLDALHYASLPRKHRKFLLRYLDRMAHSPAPSTTS